jgi:hypothetical protein
MAEISHPFFDGSGGDEKALELGRDPDVTAMRDFSAKKQ